MCFYLTDTDGCCMPTTAFKHTNYNYIYNLIKICSYYVDGNKQLQVKFDS